MKFHSHPEPYEAEIQAPGGVMRFSRFHKQDLSVLLCYNEFSRLQRKGDRAESGLPLFWPLPRKKTASAYAPDPTEA